MKKYLLLYCLAFLITLLTYSQSLQLSDSTGSLANNATILKYGPPAADEIISFVSVTNTTTSPIFVLVKKVELSVVAGTMNLFCWGACYSPEVYVSTESIEIGAGVTNSNDFSGHYIPNGILGISTIRYVFFDANNPSDSVCVNINFDTYPMSAKDQHVSTLSCAFPNPANDKVTFTYSVTQNSNAKVIIRNLLGSVVIEADIPNNTGKLSLNTSELADGVYFYTFLVNGNSQVTKKLVIRH